MKAENKRKKRKSRQVQIDTSAFIVRLLFDSMCTLRASNTDKVQAALPRVDPTTLDSNLGRLSPLPSLLLPL